jgi:hypothetical protein
MNQRITNIHTIIEVFLKFVDIPATIQTSSISTPPTKEQLAALLAKNLQLEQAKKQAEAYRDRLASSSSSDSSAYNTPAGSPDSTPVSKTKGKIKRNLDQVTNALNFSFARDSRLTRSTFKKKEGTGWPSKSSS